MNRHCRQSLCFLLLGLFFVAASSAATEPPPVFLTQWGSGGSGEGQFSYNCGIAVDDAGYVYAADKDNHRIQKFDSSGNFVRMWGWGVQDGSPIFQNCTSGCQGGIAGTGPGQMKDPTDVAVDSSGNVYVTDGHNSRIVKFDVEGNFQTQWGSFCDVYESGYDGCDGLFSQPWGIDVDASGDVYVADIHNWRIQVFDSNGTFITKWGTPGSGYGEFNEPMYVAVDEEGFVFVSDNFNDRIQKFTLADPCPVGTSQVVAGVCFVKVWGSFGTADGEFVGPGGIAVDGNGNLYVADFDPQEWDSNDRVQKFDGEGNFLTKWGSYGNGEGRFWNPSDVAIDGLGNIYVLDKYNCLIQKFGYTTEQNIEFLIGDIEELAASGYLNYGNTNALTKTLETALKSLGEGKNIPAMNKILAFINKATALVNAGRLNPGQGAELIRAAQHIVDQILDS